MKHASFIKNNQPTDSLSSAGNVIDLLDISFDHAHSSSSSSS